MRRIVLTLVGLGMLFCGTNVAMAHGYGHGYGHGYRGGYRHAYYPPVRVGVGFAPGYYGGCAPGYGYGGYATPGYGYYPQIGFGVGGSNFGLWYQQ